ncbi:MAG: PASTA domain-containing protein, partial [Vicinamibacterales bacterium]
PAVGARRVKALVVMAFLLVSACRYEEPRVFEESLRAVPDVTDATVEDAASELEADGFVVRVQRRGAPADETVDQAHCPGAEVVEQDPVAGEEVVKATTVTIVVASCSSNGSQATALLAE